MNSRGQTIALDIVTHKVQAMVHKHSWEIHTVAFCLGHLGLKRCTHMYVSIKSMYL